MFISLDFYFTFDNVPLIKNKFKPVDIYLKNLRTEALQLLISCNLQELNAVLYSVYLLNKCISLPEK